ncbi:hypothetical protein SERLADRAFT_374605 [Serpula lacrymans var. lacrymans S7.9]|uniref:Uncharacterized protein n=1 Tax=Serpula lacrymans var. lacrymans (strain S7.9) TaxID=578457 RepID=F8PCF3_SERL9|nr:uncharacterized protein SERLADRAFT_374605 [Serpula lacrymans var. lacrymans S7.9]EGO19351.1 hypothetical protein SERLADRAFT_374605 [Serpula lacrymans var. lacrymans S7.9]
MRLRLPRGWLDSFALLMLVFFVDSSMDPFYEEYAKPFKMKMYSMDHGESIRAARTLESFRALSLS